MASAVELAKRRVAVKAHLEQHGDGDWKAFQAQWNLNYKTLRRDVKFVFERNPELRARCAGLAEPACSSPSSRVKVVTTVEEVSDTPPADQDALQRVESKQQNHRSISFWGQINYLLGQCNELDARTSDDKALRETMKVRAQVLKIAAETQEKLYSAHRVEQMLRVMFEEVSKLDKPTAIAIVNRLEQVDQAYGAAIS